MYFSQRVVCWTFSVFWFWSSRAQTLSLPCKKASVGAPQTLLLLVVVVVLLLRLLLLLLLLTGPCKNLRATERPTTSTPTTSTTTNLTGWQLEPKEHPKTNNSDNISSHNLNKHNDLNINSWRKTQPQEQPRKAEPQWQPQQLELVPKQPIQF